MQSASLPFCLQVKKSWLRRWWKHPSLALRAGFWDLLIKHGQHVLLAHEEDVILATAFLELVAGPGGEEDGIADLDLQRSALAVLAEVARADCQDFALLRLLPGVVGQQDAALGFLLRRHPLDDDPVSQWPQVHHVLLG